MPDDGLLTTMMGQIAGRLDRIETRLDRIAEDMIAVRQCQAKTEERLRQGAETFAGHAGRLAALEALAERVKGTCAIQQHQDITTSRRWSRIAVIASVVGVAGTWAALLARALGWW